MKSTKGITLISLTIYILGITIAIATIAVLSSYFYKNIDYTDKNINHIIEFTEFNNFFTEETNHKDIQVVECKSNYIVFSNNVQYSFIKENKGIYKDLVKICRNVESCTFRTKSVNDKTVIVVKIKIENGQQKTMEYTLN